MEPVHRSLCAALDYGYVEWVACLPSVFDTTWSIEGDVYACIGRPVSVVLRGGSWST